jgi:MurNAc alpha-1-phosphate uridylyltransferase
MKGFILSAGLGERLRPITNYIPKPLVRFGDRTVFEISVEKFKKLNINKIAINLYHLSEIF